MHFPLLYIQCIYTNSLVRRTFSALGSHTIYIKFNRNVQMAMLKLSLPLSLHNVAAFLALVPSPKILLSLTCRGKGSEEVYS